MYATRFVAMPHELWQCHTLCNADLFNQGEYREMSSKFQEINIEQCTRVTDKAALVSIDGENHWMPFSQVESDHGDLKVGFTGSLNVATWLLDEKRIEY